MQNAAPPLGAALACEPRANTPIAIGGNKRNADANTPISPARQPVSVDRGRRACRSGRDVRANGLLVPIVLYEGMILEGLNRFRACSAAGVAPRFEQYTGNDPVGFVVSMNLRRRHLDESQRTMVAAKLATMRQGARTDLSPIGEMSQAKAAEELLNVGKRSVERAADVRGSPARPSCSVLSSGARCPSLRPQTWPRCRWRLSANFWPNATSASLCVDASIATSIGASSKF